MCAARLVDGLEVLGDELVGLVRGEASNEEAAVQEGRHGLEATGSGSQHNRRIG